MRTLRAITGTVLAIVCAVGSTAVIAHDHGTGVLEVFYALEGMYGTGQSFSHDDDDGFVNADILLSADKAHFRALGEFFVSPREGDLERLQFGYEFKPDTVLWVGRFHMPASAWNSEHHHGRYLQTSITRPFIERWEDENGLIPQHITGAFLETRQSVGTESAFEVAAGAGAGPAWGNHQFEPIDLIGGNPGRHGFSASSRIAFLPEYEGSSSAGFLFAYDRVETNSLQFIDALRSAHANLTISGPYADWGMGGWRVMAAGYYVDVALDRPARSENFVSGYVQLERQLPHDVTAFSRIENSARMQESHYVALFDDHDRDIEVALRREALGLRWDFIRRQALTMELSHVTTLGRTSNEVRLQWSGVVP